MIAQAAGALAGSAAAEAPVHTKPSGRIGPNAVTRLAEAVDELHGHAATKALFVLAGQDGYMDQAPVDMVDEEDVIALHRYGRAQFGAEAFAEIASLAGALTGHYVLQHRIPHAAQAVLRRLPAFLAARVLARAIAAHAWTFVGSGVFGFTPHRHGMLLTIKDSPLARGEQSPLPLCDFYTATFETLFRRLASRHATVIEVSCAAAGARACCFEVRY